jgi:hypothetical protein
VGKSSKETYSRNDAERDHVYHKVETGSASNLPQLGIYLYIQAYTLQAYNKPSSYLRIGHSTLEYNQAQHFE